MEKLWGRRPGLCNIGKGLVVETSNKFLLAGSSFKCTIRWEEGQTNLVFLQVCLCGCVLIETPTGYERHPLFTTSCHQNRLRVSKKITLFDATTTHTCLPQGLNSFNVALQTPRHLPPSLTSSDCGGGARVVYWVSAVGQYFCPDENVVSRVSKVRFVSLWNPQILAHLPPNFVHKCPSRVDVCALFDREGVLGAHQLMHLGIRMKQTGSTNNIFGVSEGDEFGRPNCISLSASLPKVMYCAGDLLPISFRVTNNTANTLVTCVTLLLQRIVHIHTPRRYSSTMHPLCSAIIPNSKVRPTGVLDSVFVWEVPATCAHPPTMLCGDGVLKVRHNLQIQATYTNVIKRPPAASEPDHPGYSPDPLSTAPDSKSPSPRLRPSQSTPVLSGLSETPHQRLTSSPSTPYLSKLSSSLPLSSSTSQYIYPRSYNSELMSGKSNSLAPSPSTPSYTNCDGDLVGSIQLTIIPGHYGQLNYGGFHQGT